MSVLLTGNDLTFAQLDGVALGRRLDGDPDAGNGLPHGHRH